MVGLYNQTYRVERLFAVSCQLLVVRGPRPSAPCQSGEPERRTVTSRKPIPSNCDVPPEGPATVLTTDNEQLTTGSDPNSTAGCGAPWPNAWNNGPAYFFTRSRYSPVSVSMRTTVPISTNEGTCTSLPVSKVAAFITLLLVSPFTAVSV